MIDESVSISARSWTRTVENINKIGYSDGVTDGQNASFQTSFDIGYFEGLKFGLHLGSQFAIEQQSEIQIDRAKPIDPNNINCQICLDKTTISQNIANLSNMQKEENYKFLSEK